MQFTTEETQELINRFPYLELSYDPVLPRKVSVADVFVVLPQGVKGFLWITYWRSDNLAIFIPLNAHGHMDLQGVKAYPCCFSAELALGTVMYGTFIDTSLHLFCCENIYYCRGFYVGRQLFAQKLAILNDLFSHHLRQSAFTNEFLIVGLPVMKLSFQEAEQSIASLPYNVVGIRLFTFLQTDPVGTYKMPMAIASIALAPLAIALAPAPVALAPAPVVPAPVAPAAAAIFLVKASLGMDSYTLHCHNGDYGMAMVPSYKCSVLLNNLFRTIKENNNLDLLEESDEEAEFQDVREDKFVDLNKTIPMRCVFSKRFKKWEPVSPVYQPSAFKVVSLKDAQYLEHKR